MVFRGPFQPNPSYDSMILCFYNSLPSLSLLSPCSLTKTEQKSGPWGSSASSHISQVYLCLLWAQSPHCGKLQSPHSLQISQLSTLSLGESTLGDFSLCGAPAIGLPMEKQSLEIPQPLQAAPHFTPWRHHLHVTCAQGMKLSDHSQSALSWDTYGWLLNPSLGLQWLPTSIWSFVFQIQL